METASATTQLSSLHNGKDNDVKRRKKQLRPRQSQRDISEILPRFRLYSLEILLWCPGGLSRILSCYYEVAINIQNEIGLARSRSLGIKILQKKILLH